MMRETGAMLFFVFTIATFAARQSWGYDQNTHRELSRAASQKSALAATNNNILVDLGLSADITRTYLKINK